MNTDLRHDGYAPIDAYAALGDGRTVALVAADGSVDWFPIPVMDAPPAFAAILDPHSGGRFALEPTVPYTVSRRYRPDTPVLETTFVTERGTVTVVDALNMQGRHPLPWTELAREVRADGGEVPMRWQVAPGRRFGDAEAWAHQRDDAVLIRIKDESMAVVAHHAGEPRVDTHQVSGEFLAKPGERSLVALVATDEEPVMVPAPQEILDRIEETTDEWRRWRRRIRYDGPHTDEVVRSALTLRLLTVSAEGANVAAPTTSLPEAIGGDRNFDYRFSWVRDASFALDALTNLGLMEEVHLSLSWLLQAVARTAPDVHVFYTLGGEPAPPKMDEVAILAGYEHTRPVHVGNSAANQRQLGSYGHLLDAVARYVRHGGQLDPGTATMLAQIADRTCDQWQNKDAGLWELGDYQHYTSSKIGCWTALDRAVQLAEKGQLPDWHAGRWSAVRDEIAAWIFEHCWSEDKQAFTMHPGTQDLDCAVLLAARDGFCRDERIRSTVRAIREELTARGPLLYRYSGMRQKEGAFIACSFWTVEALAYSGEVDQARELFEAMLDSCNDVGLLSEEIDPESGHLLGNFPQGLSHLALIGAATALARNGGDGR